MKHSKIILGGTALLLTVAGLASKASKNLKHVTGFETNGSGQSSCSASAVVVTATKGSVGNIVHTNAGLGHTVFTDAACNNPYLTVNNNG